MKTKPNQIVLSLSLMMKYVQMYQEQGDTLDWAEILDLKERTPVSLIEVRVDNIGTEVLATVVLGWKGEKEIKILKIEVNEPLRGKNIGNTMMKMLFATAKFYGVSIITGVIDGEAFLWDWYKKLGFTIDSGNELRMELG